MFIDKSTNLDIDGADTVELVEDHKEGLMIELAELE